MSTHVLTTDQQQRIEDILSLLDQTPIPPEVANRRGAQRLKIHVPLNIHLLAYTGTPTLTVHSRNISTRGVGFVSRRPFRKGELVAMELYFTNIAKLVLLAVSFSRYLKEGLHEVGAEFREAISREELIGRYLHQPVPPAWQALARSHNKN